MTKVRELHGLAALGKMFASARSQGRAAFLPYFPIGYPTYQESLGAVEAMADEGVDGFEIASPSVIPSRTVPRFKRRRRSRWRTVRRCDSASRQFGLYGQRAFHSRC